MKIEVSDTFRKSEDDDAEVERTVNNLLYLLPRGAGNRSGNHRSEGSVNLSDLFSLLCR